MPELLEQIDENTRLTSDYDFHTYSLGDILWHDTGVQTLGIARGYNLISTNDELKDGIERIVSSLNYHTHRNYQDARQRVIGAWLSAKGYVYKFVSLRGYSQGEWADVVVYMPMENSMEYLEGGEIETLEAWFRGDIYNVAKEQRKIYRAEDGDTIERWETIESVGGVFGSVEDLIAIGRDL
jgi:hypothetical protein